MPKFGDFENIIMSKIGKKPIKIPEGVTVNITDNKVVVKGPKGELEQKIRGEIKIQVEDNQVKVSRQSETKLSKSLHGLTRTLIANMIEGLTKGFSKTLEIHGTGYRAVLNKENLEISVGFSHPVLIVPPQGIQFQVEKNTIIKVLGADKQLVGQVADRIRKIKKPDPYKQKGIRYEGEKLRKKPGKAAKIGVAAES